MLQFFTTNRFEKDVVKLLKRGKIDKKLRKVMNALICQKALEPKHNDHKLKGNYVNMRECHIEPDWLLVYRLREKEIIFERTGSHSDLFK